MRVAMSAGFGMYHRACEKQVTRNNKWADLRMFVCVCVYVCDCIHFVSILQMYTHQGMRELRGTDAYMILASHDPPYQRLARAGRDKRHLLGG